MKGWYPQPVTKTRAVGTGLLRGFGVAAALTIPLYLTFAVWEQVGSPEGLPVLVASLVIGAVAVLVAVGSIMDDLRSR